MADKPLTEFTQQDLANPGIDQNTLHELANARPDLWQAIAAHPQCYPELRAWIEQNLSYQAAQSNPQQSDQARQLQSEGSFTQAHQTQTENSSSQASQASLSQPEDSHASDALGEIADGAKQAAAGAKQLFSETVVPFAKSATKDINTGVQDRVKAAQTVSIPEKISLYTPIINAISGAVALISLLFLPFVSVMGLPVSLVAMLDGGSSNLDVFLLIIAAVLLIAGGLFLLCAPKHTYAHIATWAVVASSALLFVEIVSCMFSIASTPFLSAGFGAYLTLLAALAAITANGLHIYVDLKSRKKA